MGGRTVGIDQGGRLRVAHLGDGCAYWNGLLAVEENRSSFCFRGGSHDGADDLTFGEYWIIRGRSGVDVFCWRIVAEVVVARGAAACFRLDEIRCVTVDVEAHVSSVEPDEGVRLRGRVFHEHFCLLDGVSGWQGLLGAYFVERDNHCGVDGTCDVEEGADDTLHACDATSIKFWCG